MKNKSWKYPFGTPADKMFDGDKNGELDTLETVFRDAYLDEMDRKACDYCKTEHRRKCRIENTPITDAGGAKQSGNSISDGAKLFVVLLVVVVSIGGLALALTVDGTMFIRAAIIFAAVWFSISLLKLAGLYK
ncbi:MAG: hypothetical protein IJB35_02825 [Oscillospiraceae bacterium]|nr:hypothetical protein [Oscillospiraceae bacterium]